MKRKKNAFVGLAVAVLLGAGTGVGTALAQAQSCPAQDNIALGAATVKRMLSLMDEQNGRISKQDFMKFMQAEFDRLDKDKSGELDVKELAHRK
jgi:Ca2+-binding EF-hand superfamily protein